MWQAEPLAFAEKLTLLVQSHAELLMNAEDMAVAQSLLQKVRGQDTHSDEGESGSMRRELNSEQVRTCPCTKCRGEGFSINGRIDRLQNKTGSGNSSSCRNSDRSKSRKASKSRSRSRSKSRSR